MNYFDSLLKHIQSLEEDFLKFYDKNNKAAGTRIRKGMQELKELAQEIRVDVKNKKDATETKSTESNQSK